MFARSSCEIRRSSRKGARRIFESQCTVTRCAARVRANEPCRWRASGKYGGIDERIEERMVEGVETSVAASVARVEKNAEWGVTVGAFDARDCRVLTDERGVPLSASSLDMCSAMRRVCLAVVGVCVDCE